MRQFSAADFTSQFVVQNVPGVAASLALSESFQVEAEEPKDGNSNVTVDSDRQTAKFTAVSENSKTETNHSATQPVQNGLAGEELTNGNEANGHVENDVNSHGLNGDVANGDVADAGEVKVVNGVEHSCNGTADTNNTSREDLQKEDAQHSDSGIDHPAALESKPFEGSTDTLTGDLAHMHSAKCEQDNQDKADRTHLSAEDEKDRTLTQSVTISTSTTDISDSSIHLKEALLVQHPSASQLVGMSTQLDESGAIGLLSLHIPEANGSGRTMDLKITNPLPLKQSAAQGKQLLL